MGFMSWLRGESGSSTSTALEPRQIMDQMPKNVCVNKTMGEGSGLSTYKLIHDVYVRPSFTEREYQKKIGWNEQIGFNERLTAKTLDGIIHRAVIQPIEIAFGRISVKVLSRAQFELNLEKLGKKPDTPAPSSSSSSSDGEAANGESETLPNEAPPDKEKAVKDGSPPLPPNPNQAAPPKQGEEPPMTPEMLDAQKEEEDAKIDILVRQQVELDKNLKVNRKINRIIQETGLLISLQQAISYAELFGLGYIVLLDKNPSEKPLSLSPILNIQACSYTQCRPVRKFQGSEVEIIHFIMDYMRVDSTSVAIIVHPSRVIPVAPLDPRILVPQACIGDRILYHCSALQLGGLAQHLYIKRLQFGIPYAVGQFINKNDETAIGDALSDGSVTGKSLIMQPADPSQQITIGTLGGDVIEPEFRHLWTLVACALGCSYEALVGEMPEQYYMLIEATHRRYERYCYQLVEAVLSRNLSEGFPDHAEVVYDSLHIYSSTWGSDIIRKQMMALSLMGNFLEVNEIREQYLGLGPILNGDKTLQAFSIMERQDTMTMNKKDRMKTSSAEPGFNASRLRASNSPGKPDKPESS